MSIYNQKNLEDHIKYGEYEKNVVFIVFIIFA